MPLRLAYWLATTALAEGRRGVVGQCMGVSAMEWRDLHPDECLYLNYFR